MDAQRDVWWHDVVAGESPTCEPQMVDAEHPLFLLYTSGSTGKPKGIQHSSAGYLLGAKLTAQWVFDLRADDVFWCTADVGWVTGHSYVAYGPLAAGATVVMYEGAPTFPDGGRWWKICEELGVTVFYTAPTAIRALMKLGDELPARYDLSRLRLLGSVGSGVPWPRARGHGPSSNARRAARTVNQPDPAPMSATFLPGRMPGINPPYLRMLSAASFGLKMMET